MPLRHDNCTCTVTYECGRQRQDVWSKKTWQASEKELQQRREAAEAAKPVKISPEQAKIINEQSKPRVFGKGEADVINDRVLELKLPRDTDIVKNNSIDNGEKNGIIISEEVVKPMINAIEAPIEQKHTGKGNPNAILTFDVELNNRQQVLLDQLTEFDSRTIVPKDSVNMADLSALTAKTGNEYAMFTKGGDRLIVRGDETTVNINVDDAKALNAEGYRWSGHTHPGIDFLCMQPSDGDYAVLDCFNQKSAVIYNSKGDFRTFEKRGD